MDNFTILKLHSIAEQMPQKAILKFTPGPQGRTSPLGVNLAPRGEHSLLFRGMEGQTENFTPRDNFTPRGQNSPLGAKFSPRGEVKNGPLLFIARICDF
jgi:hypothetical protein